MANNDTEIEIRIKIDKKDLSKIKRNLKKLTKFVKKSYQLDEYFTPSHRNFLKLKHPVEWLRIGKRDNKIILNYKYLYSNEKGQFTHCDEYETLVEKEEGLKKIFKVLDLKSLVVIEKEREVYIYNNEFELALDNVSELGYYLEIEAIKDFGSVEKTREKIFELARKIGLDPEKCENRGYPLILLQKRTFIL